MKIARIIALLATAVILIALFFLWIPVTPQFAAQPQPTEEYAGAMARVQQLQAQDSDALFPECHSLLLTHGERMTRTIVFFHGISNCPAQFAPLGQQFHAMGYNVLVPRLPHHGWADRMTEDLANLTAEELVAIADESVDIAAGLGDHVTVAGFSTGGAIAAWVAAERPEVDQAVLISAFLSPKAYPAWIVGPLARLLLILPNEFWWWDDELQAQLPGPRFAYARYPSHAMAQIMRLSFAVRQQAQRNPPQSGSVLVITNASPHETVDNDVTDTLIATWQRQGMQRVKTFEFASNLDLEHDYITIDAPNQPVNVSEFIYSTLIELIDESSVHEE